MSFNKKASLEISIQAIVIVVLAMTLLGLGLGFIKGMFGKIGGLTDSTFGKIEEQLQRDLVSSNEKLVFSQTKIGLDAGKSILLGWGIKNEGATNIDYKAEFKAINCPGSACPTLNELNAEWLNFKYIVSGKPYPYALSAAERKVERVELTVPKDAPRGLYLIELSIYEFGGSAVKPYATADIFLTVGG